ncbi:hypothetical protein [Cytophaga sp. FL35]|uniref:hypothetical protein n=1 Tax=Cytophaga sp. FL35 TaxID=1904456 RepID=UPI001653CD95|nr:hypothetical protein [Cytophaga sp. FL35]MBC6998282.1 hypothetical protein [Cytophaga sp. FL35]
MDDILLIYSNNLGLAFQWKYVNSEKQKKVQLVFRDTGLFLSIPQLVIFSNNIKTSKLSSQCTPCPSNSNCRSILIESPYKSVSFAMNQKEVEEIEDLVEGTLFQLNLIEYLSDLINK